MPPMPAPKLTEEARKDMGARFANARLHAGLSQGEVGDKLGVGRAAIAHIEAGRNVPSVPLALMAAGLFKTTLDYLLLGRKSH